MDSKKKLNNIHIKQNELILRANYFLFNGIKNKNKLSTDIKTPSLDLKNNKIRNSEKKSSGNKIQKNNNIKSNLKETKKINSQKYLTFRKKDKTKKTKNNDNELNELFFPIKRNKNEEENNINIKLVINKDISKYKPNNINSNAHLYMINKQIFFSPKKKKICNKRINLKEKNINNKINNNILIYGKPKNLNIINVINEDKNNDFNLKYFNERKNSQFYEIDIKYFSSNSNSLCKKNTKKDFYDNRNRNNINIIKEEKEMKYKNSEKNNNSKLSEISYIYFNFEDSNSSSSCYIPNNSKKDKKAIFIPKVEVKTETNLDKIVSTYHKEKNSNKNIKTNTMSISNENKKNNLELKYVEKAVFNKSNSTKNKIKSHICFIMNDDIITDNKKATIISLGTKTKKYNKINLRTFQTDDTEINKIQDILSHGDKTFSELAYDKGVSDVVDKIPSPNSHRGSKDVAPISMQNPNENYGLKSIFSIGLDKKDESFYSSSPCVSRSNSSSKVVKIITDSKKNKLKNYKFNVDKKEKITYNLIKENSKEDIIFNKDDENIFKNNIDEKDKINLEIYSEALWSEQDIELSSKLKNDLNEDILKKFQDLFNKLIKGVQNKNFIKKDLLIETEENKDDEFEEDFNVLFKMISHFEKLEENYQKECEKINDKLFKMSKLNNLILQQSFPNNHSMQNSISSFSQRLEKMDNQYNKEERNYKKTIQGLIEQLTDLSENSENAIDKKLIQEIKDIRNSKNQIINTFLINKNYPNDEKNSENIDKKELIEELERFKHEEKEYKFVIPQKYSLDTNKTKLIKNGIIRGLFVKVYENKIIDIINKHGTTKRIFPDGFQISFYNNKDIKLRYNNKDEFCFYHVNQTEEFRFPSKGIIVYKFKNGQFEKHYSNYELNIKFSDGSYRIIRKEKELFQYPEGILEFKDKKGNKSYMDSINDVDEEFSKSKKKNLKKAKNLNKYFN